MWPQKIFKFFASLRLAIVLLSACGISFAAGTFIESYHGAEAAKILVYRTPWLAVIFILLALNLSASALDRMPWKKKHTGFLTTHLGIILILLGSLISQVFGMEGQLAIEENKTQGRMTLSDSFLQVLSEQTGERWIFPLKTVPFAWKGNERLKADKANAPEIRLKAHYPKAKIEETVRESKEGSPAVHISLQGSFASVSQWLFLDREGKSEVALGPAMVRFSREPLLPKADEKSEKTGFLEFQFEDGKTVRMAVDESKINQDVPLEGTPYLVRVTRLLSDAQVDGAQLLNRSEEWNNPAVQLYLQGKEFSERHTVFAKFPEFPTVHGLKPSKAGVKVSYHFSGSSPELSKNEIRIVYREGKEPLYQIKKGTDIKEGKLELNKEIETGWMDLKLKTDHYYERSEVTQTFEPIPQNSEMTEARPAVSVQIKAEGAEKNFWIPQGEVMDIMFGNTRYYLAYGLKTLPLGFQLELKDFMMDTDPGTNQPASFKSQVILKDAAKGLERDHLIQMNEPLKHRGFKIYQSAYQLRPGEPDISIFTVARDPGNPLKYIGAIIMLSGFVMLFYVKSFSTLKSSDPKLRVKQ